MASTRTRPTALGIWLIIAAVVGLTAAFELTIEKFDAYENPGQGAACDFSVLVQCTANLNSPQGSAFGFPNPLIGLVGWMAPLVVGVAVLAGARFPKWFWAAFTAGMTFAFGFVCWLIYQSIFNLGTLCPWCMATWSVTIPSFFAVALHAIRIGAIPLGRRAAKIAEALYGWVPVITVASFAVIAIIAQLRLDVLREFL
ncbi:vitamin K epoxide reductase family protein [Microbacterium halophytorum]|uniref:vitamin K epoxide reductase family protein n=1 Tax=Microbacterium halophytorum TaxID=2067568 RepID=UPI000CFBF59B|nr:vitamin K epoxide reductase family protein [Microbacterium halophytorum]